jgi:hypothetical protein
MAQWLFCPEPVEYCHGIYLRERFEANNVDDWLRELGSVRLVEEVVNRTKIHDLFAAWI